jgi:hypothetical protein
MQNDKILLALVAFSLGLVAAMLVQSVERYALFSSTERDIKYTQAGVSLADSIAFENAAAMATEIDLPEEMPDDGDEMCAYVARDTIFLQYWDSLPEQRGMFRFKFGE